MVALSAAAPAAALDNGLARTPPMGWNDWNSFGCNVSEQLVEQTADAVVNSGLKAAGYQYVNIRRQGLSVALNTYSSIDSNDSRIAAVNATAGGLVSNGGTYYVFDWSNPGHLKAYLDLHAPFEQQGRAPIVAGLVL